MRRTGANRLSLYDRLGITLVILGMVQTFAPTCFRSARPSLHVAGLVKLPIALPDVADTSAGLPASGPTLASESGQDPETDQESHDTEDLTESFTWSEAITVRRTIQRSPCVAAIGPAPRPVRASDRTRSALQQSRMNAIAASSAASMTARLCRMTC